MNNSTAATENDTPEQPVSMQQVGDSASPYIMTPGDFSAPAKPSTQSVPSFPSAPASMESFEWDGRKESLPLSEPKKMAYLSWCFFSHPNYSMRFPNAASKDEYFRRRRIFGEASHKLEQGLPTIEMATPTYDQIRHTGRAASRAEIIAKLTELNSGDTLDTAPLRITETNPLIVRAIMDKQDVNNLKIHLLEGRRNLAAYALAFWQVWEKINWNDRRDELKLELTNAANLSMERIEQIQLEIMRLEPSNKPDKPSTAEIIADATCGVLAVAYAPVATISEMLLNELVEVLERHKELAISSEKFFFSQHDLPHESTAVSRRHDSLIKNLRVKIDGMKNMPAHVAHHRPVHPSHTVISSYVEVLAGVV